jgi:hypothetical protein
MSAPFPMSLHRHGRACPDHPSGRWGTLVEFDDDPPIDGRDKPGHDDLFFTNSLQHDGFAIVAGVVSEDERRTLAAVCDEIVAGHLARGGRECGVRNLLSWTGISKLAYSQTIRALIEPTLGATAQVTRGILFDKRDGANWGVLWHQDLSLAVAERAEVPGWGPWTKKDGVHHVQPSASVLSRMLTLRIHIDACGSDNGPLSVLPGSHSLGRLNGETIRALRERTRAQVCAAAAGAAIVMRPLLVHSSLSAVRPARRRVIHLEYVDPSALPPAVRLCDA